MTTQPTIPAAAIAAVEAVEVWTHPTWPHLASSEAEDVLRAALPHLLPGLYVTRDSDDGPVIWVEDPDRPTYPIELLDRSGANSRLFDILAALIPDRTDEEEPA